MITDREHSTPLAAVYQQVYSSPVFSRLLRERRRFVVPIALGFMMWYTGYIFAAAYAPAVMAHKVAGNITVALIMGVLQVLSIFVITAWYVRFATRQTDPEVVGVRELFDEIRREQRFLEPERPPARRPGARPGAGR